MSCKGEINGKPLFKSETIPLKIRHSKGRINLGPKFEKYIVFDLWVDYVLR
jgi:hypothetical protein